MAFWQEPILLLASRPANKIIQIQHNRIKNPNWQEAPSWLFTSVAEAFNTGQPITNPASGQSVTRTRDRGIASPTRWPLGHAAVIVSNRKTVEGTVKENENETYRLLGHNAIIFFLPCSMLWSRADNKKNKLLSEATANCKPRDCKGQLQPSLIFNCVNAHNLLYYSWITFFCLRHLYKVVKTKGSFLWQNTLIVITKKEM